MGKADVQELPATEDGVVIRPALEVLAQLRAGQVMDQLSVELNRVVAGVRDCKTGKAGEVLLKIKIAPLKQHHNAVSLQAQVIGKAPEDPPELDLMFYDDDGNLHTRNPNQRDIFDDGPQGV